MLPQVVLDRNRAPHAVDLFLAEPDLPFFAEFALFCWGPVDYESQGDCARPTDRRWSWLELRGRAGQDRVLVFKQEHPEAPEKFPHPLRVQATSSRLVWLAAYFAMRSTPALAFLRRRGHMTGFGALGEQLLGDVNLEDRWERGRPLRGQFESEVLRPFDSMAWWGGWKWYGDFASAGSLPLRRIMRAVLADDRSVLPQVLAAVEEGIAPERREGYLHAARQLTGASFSTEEECLEWWRRGPTGK
ncbi:MAG: hypothetical protein HYY16_04230 [Planctomycetes bacterium]|nr:hypothetical protein [Planctomycetota bacterium]